MNRLGSYFSKIFLKPIVDFLLIKEVKGRENIPRTNFILVSNHQSHLDWLADAYICVPRRFTFIGQVDRYSGLLGFSRDILYLIGGVIRLDRKSVESKGEVVDQAITALKKGYILILYPEGTRTRTGEIGEGKWGTAKFFLETGVPILPLAIEGTSKLLPVGGKLKVQRIIKINIGQTLYFREALEATKKIDKDSKEYKHFLAQIAKEIMREITSLKSEIT